MKVLTDFTGCAYLTAGKEYEVEQRGLYKHIIDDEEEELCINLDKSAHLRGAAWTVIEELEDAN
jgi:hypothetical protein